ncbi:hypothetical protein [Lysobacter terrae]
MTVRRLLPVLVLALPLLACKPSASEQTSGSSVAPPPEHKTASAPTHWQCDRLAVTTYFDDASLESITLETPERRFTLKSMADEGGARFADAAGNEFRSRPGSVVLALAGQPTAECRKLRADASASR